MRVRRAGADRMRGAGITPVLITAVDPIGDTDKGGASDPVPDREDRERSARGR